LFAWLIVELTLSQVEISLRKCTKFNAIQSGKFKLFHAKNIATGCGMKTSTRIQIFAAAKLRILANQMNRFYIGSRLFKKKKIVAIRQAILKIKKKGWRTLD
jgi:hypothetical protein